MNFELKDFIGDAAMVCTIAVFLSGVEICKKIHRNQSVKDISPIPFLCGLISCTFWLRYGLLISDAILTIVNTIGAILQMLYICWYMRYNTSDTFNSKLLTVLVIISCFYILTTFCVTQDNASFYAGIACCTAGVIFMGSPLSSVAQVIKTKSTESLPFSMILFTFVMAFLWYIYGLLTHDTFVQVPNLLGCLLALFQLSLFLKYPSYKKHTAVSLA